MSASTAPAQERAFLAVARDGDENAFRELVEPYRRELHAHCYRMLASLPDAEDALQEALLRAWRALGRFEDRGTVRAWLYRIATNTCLDVIAKRPRRVLPGADVEGRGAAEGFGVPPAENVWLDPYPDEQLGDEDGSAAPEARYELREGLELAFIAALQHLSARQRAVLILREVLGFSAQEVAGLLESSTASVNSALQRARRSVAERLPERSQQATLRAIGDARLREIVEGYMDAMHRGDVDRVVAMLTQDAAWSMPPLPVTFGGRDAIREFLTAGPLSGEWRWRHLPSRASGQLAGAAYAFDEEHGTHLPFALDVLTLEGPRIKAITSFITRSTASADPEYYRRYPAQPLDPARVTQLFGRLGLPERLD